MAVPLTSCVKRRARWVGIIAPPLARPYAAVEIVRPFQHQGAYRTLFFGLPRRSPNRRIRNHRGVFDSSYHQATGTVREIRIAGLRDTE